MNNEEIIKRIQAAREAEGLDQDEGGDLESPVNVDSVVDQDNEIYDTEEEAEEEAPAAQSYTDEQVSKWREDSENASAMRTAAQERNEDAARQLREATAMRDQSAQTYEQQQSLLNSVSNVSGSMDPELFQQVMSGFSGQAPQQQPVDMRDMDPAVAQMFRQQQQQNEQLNQTVNNMANMHAGGMLKDEIRSQMKSNPQLNGLPGEFADQIFNRVNGQTGLNHGNYQNTIRSEVERVSTEVGGMEKAVEQRYLAGLAKKKRSETHGSVSGRGPKASRGSSPAQKTPASEFSTKPGEAFHDRDDRRRKLIIQRLAAAQQEEID